MLIAIVAGTGYYRNSKLDLQLGKNIVGLIEPKDPGVMVSDPKDPYFHYYARFNGTYAKYLAHQILKERESTFFKISNMRSLAAVMKGMGINHNQHLPDAMGKREILLARALNLLQTSVESPGEESLLERELLYFIDQHIAEPTSLKMMAAHFGVTTPSLCRAVKRTTGSTVVEIQERERISRAKVLLESNLFNVSECSVRVGYQDPFYFSKIFKKHTGISPKKWQQRNGKG